MATNALREKPWILLPGTLCNADVFDPFLDFVGVEKALRHHIVLKHAQPEDYLPELQKFVSTDAVVCGFSLGAIVAAHLADRVDASQLLLFGLNPYADDPAKAAGRLDMEAAVRAEGGRTALESRLPPIHGPSPSLAREHILCMADKVDEYIGAQTALALNRPGAMNALAAASCPIRLLTGSNDSSAPFELAQAAAKVAVDGQALMLDGLGHYALVEDPELCYENFKRIRWEGHS